MADSRKVNIVEGAFSPFSLTGKKRRVLKHQTAAKVAARCCVSCNQSAGVMSQQAGRLLDNGLKEVNDCVSHVRYIVL